MERRRKKESDTRRAQSTLGDDDFVDKRRQTDLYNTLLSPKALHVANYLVPLRLFPGNKTRPCADPEQVRQVARTGRAIGKGKKARGN